jgi:uncharacterized protein (DUF58 family)
LRFVPLPARVTTPVKRKPTWDFSVPGMLYCSMTMFMGIAAMNTQANLLFGVFGLMVGVLLISVGVSGMVLGKLTVRRSLPDAAVVGQKVAIGYEFANGKRFWPSLSVQVSELDGVEAFRRQSHAYLLHAAAEMSADVEVEVTPKRRGVHRLGQYQISTSFPFGFVKRAVVRYQEDSLLVFPALARMDGRVLRLMRSAETSGVTVRPKRGGEDEMYGVKEYRPGENPRLIHWKRTARTGLVVSREMSRVSPPRVMIIVDTFLPERSVEAHELVERTIAVAASLASEALEQGLLVGVTAAAPTELDAKVVVSMQPSRGKRHRRDVLSGLAKLRRNEHVRIQELIGEAMRSARAGTTPVVVTGSGLELNLAEQSRGTMVVLQVKSAMVEQWFRFEGEVDFTTTMPMDQQPAMPAGVPAGGKAAGRTGTGKGAGHV